MNIKEALEYGIKFLKENKIDEPLLKARIILANILGQNKEYLIIHEKEELSKSVEIEYKKDLKEIAKRVPIQYITKKQEFMGLEFYVDKNVLIPQPDTEILVEVIINICKDYYINDTKIEANDVRGWGPCNDPNKKQYNKNIKILDLCTGSGAIGISILKNIKNCEMTLLDISKEALNVAKQNCVDLVGADDPVRQKKYIKNNVGVHDCTQRKEVNIQIIKSDLFKELDNQNKYDIIVSNPPYIKSRVIKTLDKEVQNEPILALDGGEDGLEIYRRIIKKAHEFLEPNGYLCLEIGYDQRDEVIELIKTEEKYTEIYSKKDLSGNDRIIICKYKEN